MSRPAFKVISHVTVPVMKIDGTKPVYITFLEPIHLAPENDKQKAIREKLISEGKQVKPVPEICKVRNIEDGHVYQIVANEVFKSEMRQNYPADAYVNKSFQVFKSAPEGNRQYATFQIAEIELEVEEADMPPASNGAEAPQTEAPNTETPAAETPATDTPAEEAHANGKHGRKR